MALYGCDGIPDRFLGVVESLQPLVQIDIISLEFAFRDASPEHLLLEMMEAHRQLRDVALEHSRKTMSDVITRIIKRSMNQVETEPSMTPEEAVAALRAL